MNHALNYRPEIDGLRAIAVVLVILFHTGYPQFASGFIGVDIFFVISGYLITSIIAKELNQNTFCLKKFYLKRARRILPACFFMLLCTLPFAYCWLMPSDFRAYGKSLISTLSFSSNIIFWRESGYFDIDEQLKPLIHTWSLSVEEQFYLIFPLLLILFKKFNLTSKKVLFTLLIIFMISLSLAQWGSTTHTSANFFLLPTRFWEILLGGLLGYFQINFINTYIKLTTKSFINELLSFVGLALIGLSVFYFNAETPHPSLYTLLPLSGCLLILFFSNQSNYFKALFSLKPLIFMGLISYSLYLFHQPIFAFARHRSFVALDKFDYIGLIGLTFLISIFSWYCIEQPFRSKTKFNDRFILKFSSSLISILLALGIGIYLTNGLETRTTRNNISLKSIEDKISVNHGLHDDCEGKLTFSKNCQTSTQPEILLWGDSYAMHLAKGLKASNPNIKMIQMTKSTCGPILDLALFNGKVYNQEWAKYCIEDNNKVMEWLKQNKSVKYVILASPFRYYFGEKNLYFQGHIIDGDNKFLYDKFKQTLDKITTIGKTAIIVAPPPSNDKNIGQCLAKRQRYNSQIELCDFAVTEISPSFLTVYQFLDQFSHDFKIINLKNAICDNRVCHSSILGKYIYRDGGHLAIEGSSELGKQMNFYNLVITPKN